jgi:hypothetical protein
LIHQFADHVSSSIEEAEVTFRNKKPITLKNWVLSVRTNLDQLSLDDKPDDTPEMKEKKAFWRADIDARYKGFVPGDYRTQRVFAALASEPGILVHLMRQMLSS